MLNPQNTVGNDRNNSSPMTAERPASCQHSLLKSAKERDRRMLNDLPWDKDRQHLGLVLAILLFEPRRSWLQLFGETEFGLKWSLEEFWDEDFGLLACFLGVIIIKPTVLLDDILDDLSKFFGLGIEVFLCVDAIFVKKSTFDSRIGAIWRVYGIPLELRGKFVSLTLKKSGHSGR